MKKRLALISILSLILLITFMQIQQNLSNAQNNKTRIPKDAIRLRILANSDSAADQAVKRQIRDEVNQNIEGWVRDLKTTEQAKDIINSHMDDLNKVVAKKLKDMHLNESFTIKLGKADFPTKMYGGYVYPAGQYQALVVTLGQGDGANWWCVLFPPLCYLDFSNGDAIKPDEHVASAAEKASNASVSEGTNTKEKDNQLDESETQTQSETKIQSEAQTQSKVETKRDAQIESKANTQNETQTESKVQTQNETEPQSETVTQEPEHEETHKQVKVKFFLFDALENMKNSIF